MGAGVSSPASSCTMVASGSTGAPRPAACLPRAPAGVCAPGPDYGA